MCGYWCGHGVAWVYLSIHSSIPTPLPSSGIGRHASKQGCGAVEYLNPQITHQLLNNAPLLLHAGSCRSGKICVAPTPPTTACAMASRPTAAAPLRRTRGPCAAPTVLFTTPSPRWPVVNAEPRAIPRTLQRRAVLLAGWLLWGMRIASTLQTCWRALAAGKSCLISESDINHAVAVVGWGVDLIGCPDPNILPPIKCARTRQYATVRADTIPCCLYGAL